MQNNKALLLVVEDDRSVRNLMANTLELHGYKCIKADNGQNGLLQITSYRPDIIMLDLGLPDMDGVEVIQKVRQWSICPIIVISARAEDSDKIAALDAGADDYLTKPFSVEELLARVRSTVRRLQYQEGAGVSQEQIFRNGDLVIDYSAATVSVGGKQLHLMPIEYNVLCLLARNVGRVLTYSYILDHVWKSSLEGDVASLRVYMASLRKKIEPGDEKGKYIQTHIGIGYRMLRVE